MVKWTREKIQEVLIELSRGTGELGISSIRGNNLGLSTTTCICHFGTVREAIESCGLRYVISGNMGNRRNNWSKSIVVDRILHISSNGEPLNSLYIQNNYYSLFSAGRKYCGSWKGAIECAGLNYNDVSKNGKYSKKEIVKVIKETKKAEGCVIRAKLGISFGYYCDKYFTSWDNALKECGIDPKNESKIIRQKHKKIWTNEIVLGEIKKLYESGEPLDTQYIRDNYNELYCASNRYSGGYPNAVRLSGIDYNNLYLTRQKWNKETIINDIIDLHGAKGDLRYRTAYKSNRLLLASASRYFGTWGDAVKFAGFDYDEISEEYMLTSRNKGRKFEKLFEDILTEIRVDFKRYDGGNTNYKPDFVLQDGCMWLDTKLSDFTCFNDNTIEKYEPHCDTLTIVYLCGDEKSDRLISNKTRLVSVYKFLEDYDFENKEMHLEKLIELEASECT